MAGKFSRLHTAVRGTWRNRATIMDANGATVDTCDSGTVRWSAKQ